MTIDITIASTAGSAPTDTYHTTNADMTLLTSYHILSILLLCNINKTGTDPTLLSTTATTATPTATLTTT
eukprot:8212725-Pyramimonas_sp.AAC.1